MADSNGNGKTKMTSIWLSVLFAMLALAVQWGVFTANLNGIGKNLTVLTTEIRSMRQDFVSIERRLSYLEGRTSRSINAKGDTP